MAKLIDRMQRSMGVKVVATSYNQGTNSQRYAFRMPSWTKGIAQLLSTSFGQARQQPSPCLPQHSSSNGTAVCAPTCANPQQQQSLHLMACMQRGRYRRTVRQDRVDNITTDRALFCFMRSQLAKHRGRMRKFFSLKCVQGLYFVKVSLHYIN